MVQRPASADPLPIPLTLPLESGSPDGWHHIAKTRQRCRILEGDMDIFTSQSSKLRCVILRLELQYKRITVR